jgi:hypothetical protein
MIVQVHHGAAITEVADKLWAEAEYHCIQLRRGKRCHKVLATLYGTRDRWYIEVARPPTFPKWMIDDPVFDGRGPARGVTLTYALFGLEDFDAYELWCERCKASVRQPLEFFVQRRRGRPTPRAKPEWVAVPPNAEHPG